ncbi:hypothetical protein [Legionella israelensis]|nr:hypothetical protein [Legionella israelensis]
MANAPKVISCQPKYIIDSAFTFTCNILVTYKNEGYIAIFFIH